MDARRRRSSTVSVASRSEDEQYGTAICHTPPGKTIPGLSSSPPEFHTAIQGATPKPAVAAVQTPPPAMPVTPAPRPSEQAPPIPQAVWPGKGKKTPGEEPEPLDGFKFSEKLGSGSYGTVWKALRWSDGKTVAIKLFTPPRGVRNTKKEFGDIEREVGLLKSLRHENIVQYFGVVRTEQSLNIILEYLENGSLSSMLKKYGKFPEETVSLYMGQALKGLSYLHEQGTVHRDIKGANILANKDGVAKLADFGVSVDVDEEVEGSGTAHFMAPEIIGNAAPATPASDIWSVGATVIELLTGRPPFADCSAPQALWAIVNKELPLPQGVSPACTDFMMQCFQKNPDLRISAKKLLQHPFIVKRLSEKRDFQETVGAVQQWNQAIGAPPPLSVNTNVKPDIRSPQAKARSQIREPPSKDVHSAAHPDVAVPAKGPLALARNRRAPQEFSESTDENWDDDFVHTISPSALQRPQLQLQDNFAGRLSSERLKALASSPYRNFGDENSSGSYLSQDNFSENSRDELKTVRPSRSQPLPEAKIRDYKAARTPPSGPPRFRDRQKTLTQDDPRGMRVLKQSPLKASPMPVSPPKTQLVTRFGLPSRSVSLHKEKSNDDFSGLDFDDDVPLNLRPGLESKDESRSPKLFLPSDLTNTPRSLNSPLRRRPESRGRAGFMNVQSNESPRRVKYSIEIQRFAETEDDNDFSDVVVQTPGSPDSDTGDESGALMFNSKTSNRSWLGDEDEEEDPFKSLDKDFKSGEMNLEEKIARDSHAQLCATVDKLIGSLKVSEPEEELYDASEKLVNSMWENKATAKGLIIAAHGMLPILEILEPCTIKSDQHMILNFLQIINYIIDDDVEIQENLCFVGGIPAITKFTARQYSYEIRREAAAFVRQMYQTSTLTLQMFVSAGGLHILVEFLDEDFDEAREFVLIGVNGIWNVFDLQGPTPKNDFCRILARSNILYPLSMILTRVLNEDDETAELIEGRIVNIFYLFSKAENYVMEVVSDRVVLKSVFRDLNRMSPDHQITMLRFIKNLSMLSTTLDSLHSANAIETLVELLSTALRRKYPHVRDVATQTLPTLFNLCRVSKVRQEDAAVNGIIPLLQNILAIEKKPERERLLPRVPKEFVLPILFDMAHSGKIGRKFLWQNSGLKLYLSLLKDQYWQVQALDSIEVWLTAETAKVEESLIKGNFVSAINHYFQSNEFDWNMLPSLESVLRLSPALAKMLANPYVFEGVKLRLRHKKPVIRLNLLKVVRSICDAADSATQAIKRSKLFHQIQELAVTDPAILVRNMAGDLVASITSAMAVTPRRQATGSGSRREREESSRRGESSMARGERSIAREEHGISTPKVTRLRKKQTGLGGARDMSDQGGEPFGKFPDYGQR